MGRYIHADDYEGKVFFKYWFGSQQSELEYIVCPFGGVVVNRATIDGVSNFDEISVTNEVYVTMSQRIDRLVKLLDPYVINHTLLINSLLEILRSEKEAVGTRLTMEYESEFDECRNNLSPHTPDGELLHYVSSSNRRSLFTDYQERNIPLCPS